MKSAREELISFDIHTLPSLDVVTLGALELFTDEPITQTLPQHAHLLVIGSVGALVAGKIMYAGTNTLFADESTFLEVLNNNPQVDGVLVISASGSKHAVDIVRALQPVSLPVTLLTNNQTAPAGEFLTPEQLLVLPKNREPYTNNTSTYLGMILTTKPENTGVLLDFIQSNVTPTLTIDFSRYTAFTFILPKEFSPVCQLIRIKFEEMFEPLVHGRAYSEEEIKHAKTVVPSDTELFVSLGVGNQWYGAPENRLAIPLPGDVGSAGVLAIAYYIVGAIQNAHPPYFKDNITQYAEQASRIFGKDIQPIVE